MYFMGVAAALIVGIRRCIAMAMAMAMASIERERKKQMTTTKGTLIGSQRSSREWMKRTALHKRDGGDQTRKPREKKSPNGIGAIMRNARCLRHHVIVLLSAKLVIDATAAAAAAAAVVAECMMQQSTVDKLI